MTSSSRWNLFTACNSKHQQYVFPMCNQVYTESYKRLICIFPYFSILTIYLPQSSENLQLGTGVYLAGK